MTAFLAEFGRTLARALGAVILFAVLSGAATQPVYDYTYAPAAVTR